MKFFDIEFSYNQRDLHCVYVAGTANCLRAKRVFELSISRNFWHFAINEFLYNGNK